MRLAFYAGLIPERKTGLGVHMTHLLHNLVRLRPDAEYVSFLPSLRHSDLHRQSLARTNTGDRIAARTVPIPGRAMHLAQTYLRIPSMEWLLRQQYDVFHQMHVTTDPAVPSGKLVVSMHDTVSLHWANDESPLFRRAGRLLRRAAAIITVSEYSRQCIIDAFGVDPHRVQVIHNGCDHTLYHSGQAPAILEAALVDLGIRRPYMIYIGGQAPRKNLPRLIAAFARARQIGSLPHTLVLAGPLAPLRSDVSRAIAASGCSQAIQVLGYVDDQVVPHLYAGADLLLFPSLYEGFGLPVVEALACGTPVVTSATTSLPEVAGDAAVLVDPESEEAIAAGILSILQECEDVRAARIARGVAQAGKFSWERCAREHLAVYDAVIAQGGR
jgi:glycosyltransferase involved in cell wall biosynthesis